MNDSLKNMALHYHKTPKPGKIAITATKKLDSQRDLSLAYSPGVALACEEIVKDELAVFDYTSKGNLVAVITNGTAVLGLGNIGPLASKPVMEGKAVLFKKFADIDVYDIEIKEQDPSRLIEIIAALEPTFGGINLEDIKAPECFIVEQELCKKMAIPVFHDDQHGTAIVTAAGMLNALKIQGKSLEQAKLVCSGAGAAAISCLNLLLELGLKKDNVIVADKEGIINTSRTDEMDEQKRSYMSHTQATSLAEVLVSADIFLGLSAAKVLDKSMVAKMADKPIIFALANPTPEIMPEDALEAKPDAIIATGRSDYPNQINNVLCFPYIFRGALDAGAKAITKNMQIAAARAIAELAHKEQHHQVAEAYKDESMVFGKNYIIPKPFDPRLLIEIAPAVAKAAALDGVATRPISDNQAYLARLREFIDKSGSWYHPIYAQVKDSKIKKRLVFAEGEDERVLRAVKIIQDENLAEAILLGRPEVIRDQLAKLHLNIDLENRVKIVYMQQDPRYQDFSSEYHRIMERKGVTLPYATIEMGRRNTLIAAMLLKQGFADGMICGTFGTNSLHRYYVDAVLGKEPGVGVYATMTALLLQERNLFFVDTKVNYAPTPEELVEIAILASEQMRLLGVEPKIAFVSNSNFGSRENSGPARLAEALALLKHRRPDIEADGEMRGDCALDEAMRQKIMPRTHLKGEANLMIFSSCEVADVSYELLHSVARNGSGLGPMLLGVQKPAHILTATASVRNIVNMSVIAAHQAING